MVIVVALHPDRGIDGSAWRFLALMLAATAVFLLGAFWLRSSNQVPDDAFITLRYATHVAEGLGPRFNPGGDLIEGFSSPLHMLLLAGALKLGAEPLVASQLSSLVPALMCVWLLVWWAPRRLGWFWGTLATLALAANPALWAWSRGGLETALCTLLILSAMITAEARRWRVLATIGGLIALTRPEGVLYWFPILSWTAVVSRRGGQGWRPALAMFGLMMAMVLPWFVFRVAAFHDILPNTYYAKMDGVRLALVWRGLEYLGGFLGRSEILLPALLAGLYLVVTLCHQRLGRTVAWPGWVVLCLAFVLPAAVFVLSAGGDHMVHYRFLLPAVPLILLLGAWGGRRLQALITRRPARELATIVLVFLFCSQPLRILSHELRHPTYPLDRPVGLVEPFDDGGIISCYRLGLVLRESVPPETTLAVVPAGALPYASGLQCIDMLGLNDREIARQRVDTIGQGYMAHEKGDGRLVLARKPDLILLHNLPEPRHEGAVEPTADDFRFVPIVQIWRDPEFARTYQPVVVEIDSSLAFTLYRRMNGL